MAISWETTFTGQDSNRTKECTSTLQHSHVKNLPDTNRIRCFNRTHLSCKSIPESHVMFMSTLTFVNIILRSLNFFNKLLHWITALNAGLWIFSIQKPAVWVSLHHWLCVAQGVLLKTIFQSLSFASLYMTFSELMVCIPFRMKLSPKIYFRDGMKELPHKHRVATGFCSADSLAYIDTTFL